MDESSWMSSDHPKPILTFLRGKASDRKLRLFMAACCRRVIHTFTDDEDIGREEAIDVAERYADGLADDDEREAVLADLTDGGPHRLWDYCTNLVVADFTKERPDDADGVDCAIGAAEEARLDSVQEDYDESEEIKQAEAAAQTFLVRDVFGNPFRPVKLRAALRTPTIVGLAEAAYENRSMPQGELDPVRLSVLADALEESGAASELVEHLREKGPHVRGCFAVDLCLGRK
jgi:hypothetical protein